MLTQLSDKKNIALLGALCLFLSAIEYMIPKPLPFMRIGLANLPLMLALDILPVPSFLVLICIKVIGQALITGTLFSYVFLFSLAGTFFSALSMFALRRGFGKEKISFIGIGTAGAMISNAAQLALAYFFIFKENVFYIAPAFLGIGLVTGILLGWFTEEFTQRRGGAKEEIKEEENVKKKKNKFDELFSAESLFVTGLFIVLGFLFNSSTELRVVQFLFFVLLVFLSGKRVNLFLTVFVFAGIVLFNLFVPYGRVLFSVGFFNVTEGALRAGVHRAVTFQALMMLSKLTVREDLKISGAFGELLGESLRIFSAMMNRKYKLTGKNIFAQIDNLLFELSALDIPVRTEAQKTKPAGFVALALIIILSWIPFGMNYLLFLNL